jgi:hypothetical protein
MPTDLVTLSNRTRIGRMRAEPPDLYAVAKLQVRGGGTPDRGDLRAAAGTPVGGLTGAPVADLEGLILDRLVRRAVRAVRLRLIVAAPRRR